MNLIRAEHYPAEKHTVKTEDGYILTLHRIPKIDDDRRNRKVVLLMHGEFVRNNSFQNYRTINTEQKIK